MAYSEDYRKRVNEYLDEGHTWAEARETFKISMTAISSWRKKHKETGEVKDAPPRRKAFRKLEPEKLLRYVDEHPDAYLKEIGEAFGCSDTAVLKAFKRLGITRKKRQNGTKSKIPNR
jgi:transposase